MVDGNLFIPLSPPHSPRMSAYSTATANNDWQPSEIKPLDTASPPNSESEMALLHAEVASHKFDVKRPLLQSHKSYPYALNSKFHEAVSHSPSREIHGFDEVETANLPTVTFGGSAPASPVSRLSPPSPHTASNPESKHDHLQGDEVIMDERDGEVTDEKSDDKPISAAELRNQKRKMKRFRLTHNQTRFLMSEFARQAHPDAAHRERLSREIPGLSPRQVQVWFQNRRAKLKRLTSDDRERIMRSRALPEDFDMAQALHVPFGSAHGLGDQLPSPGSYTSGYGEGNMMRPLSIDTLRRGPLDSHMSPTGISPAFGGFSFTPPHSATDLSPGAAHENSPFGFPSAPLDGSPRTSNPFSVSMAPSPAYAAHGGAPRLSIHADRLARSRAESLQSPLRTSISYASSSHDHHQHQHHNINGSPESSHLDSSIGSERSGVRSYSGSIMPYGIGSSYTPVTGFQASTQQRMRSFSSSVPRRIELSTHYVPNRGSNAPQTATFSTYTSSSLAAPPSYAIPQLSAPHQVSSFQNSYLRPDSDSGDHYSGVGAILGEVIEGSAHENDDHSDQLSQSY